ncbi:hypothetical protein [Staphylococcus gallinarum]|uniref:Uncharacterized protein n=1 Tax=Staphylococcus gallinarum TaxID=1293 RepID=A0ABQ0Y2F0_STAGA|nr:hypothetical protein [Staphylococcus gallinarum]GEQ05563.1 hypothetical protein SGA02_13910 [Staphylococcus gallinarum]
MKWDFNDYFKPGYSKTPNDDFIEFLLVIKQMHLNNKISEEQKIKKFKDYANKIYPKL